MSFIKDLIGNFGGGRSRDDLGRGYGAAKNSLMTGGAEADESYRRAGERFGGYERAGAQYRDAYGRSMGFGTPEELEAEQGRYFDDPVNKRIMEAANQGILRGSIGNVNSGKFTQSITNSLLQGWRQHQDRLRAGGTEGMQAAGAAAGVDVARAGTRFGLGQQLASNDQSYHDARAKSWDTGINNLLKIAGVGAQAVGYATGQKKPGAIA